MSISGGTEPISKAICLEESVKLFEHVSLANRTIVINHIYGGAIRQIGTWFIKDSTIHFSVDKEFERIIYLDKYGIVWIRKAQHADEGTYTLLSKEDTGAEHIQITELIMLGIY
ncbi:hypothetical protein CHS0354_039307 [Potamilus streckersoni]|uniref:Uncharacterized protein n=1 Tax=Potamilus streckersoni TaxID=2493646 RepID=A0AAE0SXU7_9BIVA|nr:hypothetical protein CHS0354_039307 [Potamilus streckersoni]